MSNGPYRSTMNSAELNNRKLFQFFTNVCFVISMKISLAATILLSELALILFSSPHSNLSVHYFISSTRYPKLVNSSVFARSIFQYVISVWTQPPLPDYKCCISSSRLTVQKGLQHGNLRNGCCVISARHPRDTSSLIKLNNH